MSGTPKRKPGRRPDLELAVQYGVRSERTPTRAKLRQWMHAALKRSAVVTLRIIGTREARSLNRRFRGLDYATNVLTFPYSERRPLAGDIAICAPVVAREARAFGIEREAHYAHLTVHGTLHLQGYDHLRTRAALRMERLETRILNKLGYADPYGGEKPGESREKKNRLSRASRLSSPVSRSTQNGR